MTLALAALSLRSPLQRDRILDSHQARATPFDPFFPHSCDKVRCGFLHNEVVAGARFGVVVCLAEWIVVFLPAIEAESTKAFGFLLIMVRSLSGRCWLREILGSCRLCRTSVRSLSKRSVGLIRLMLQIESNG